nr:MAG TPA: hypothetical protein [Caudoviricetes sp.]
MCILIYIQFFTVFVPVAEIILSTNFCHTFKFKVNNFINLTYNIISIVFLHSSFLSARLAVSSA